MKMKKKCPTCNGLGWWWTGADPQYIQYCYKCDGKGKIKTNDKDKKK